MRWRGKSDVTKSDWRVIFFVALPVMLLSVAWKVRESQKPVKVHLGDHKIASRLLFERINVEVKQHPYASKIEVSWARQWDKKSNLELFDYESLEWDRVQNRLSYTIDSYGWVYSQVETSGLDVLAQAHLQETPIELPASVYAQLRARGWTLTEHYLP